MSLALRSFPSLPHPSLKRCGALEERAQWEAKGKGQWKEEILSAVHTPFGHDVERASSSPPLLYPRPLKSLGTLPGATEETHLLLIHHHHLLTLDQPAIQRLPPPPPPSTLCLSVIIIFSVLFFPVPVFSQSVAASEAAADWESNKKAAIYELAAPL